MQLIRCDNSFIIIVIIFLALYNLKQKPLWEGPRQTEQDQSVRLNISLLAVRCDLYCDFPAVACFTRPRQNLSVTAEIQYIKRDTFGIFTLNNKDYWWEVASMATGGEKQVGGFGGGREGREGQSTQPETKEEDSCKHTARSFFTQLMLS